jgi:hypothetical protein
VKARFPVRSKIVPSVFAFTSPNRPIFFSFPSTHLTDKPHYISYLNSLSVIKSRAPQLGFGGVRLFTRTDVVIKPQGFRLVRNERMRFTSTLFARVFESRVGRFWIYVTFSLMGSSSRLYFLNTQQNYPRFMPPCQAFTSTSTLDFLHPSAHSHTE